MSVKKMMMIVSSVTIIFVQEQLLMFLPNIQFTVLLIILFSSVFSFRESILMVFVYVFLDSLYMGSLSPFTVIPLLIGWFLIPILYHLVLRKTENEYKLAFFALAFGFIYGWVFIPFHMIQTGITNPIPYLLADLPFEMIMGATGFLTVLWAYKPLKLVLDQLVFSEVFDVKKSNS